MFSLTTPQRSENPRSKRRKQGGDATPFARRLLLEPLESRWLLTSISGAITTDTLWNNTAQEYVIVGNVTVNPGATLTIASGVTVRTQSSTRDIFIDGTVRANGVTFTGSTELIVRNNGRLELTNSSVAGEAVEYRHGGTGWISGSQFSTAQLRLFSKAFSTVTATTFQSAEPANIDPTIVPKLYGNTFAPNATILVKGAVDANTEWRVDGNLARYRVDNYWFQVNAGATLTLGPGVEVIGHRSYDSNIYGTLVATGARFTGTTRMVVRSAGRLNLTDCEVAGTRVEYRAGSLGQIGHTRFAANFYIDSGASVAVANNSFENAPNVYATGSVAAEIDMTQNWWGTVDTAVIEQKIIDRQDAPTSRPRIIYQPFLTSWPPVGAVLSIAPLDAVKPEGNSATTPFTFTVTRSGAASGTATVNWTVTGTGANPANAADFADGTLPSGVVTFNNNETSKTITVLVAGDTLVEPDETFVVTLSGAVGAQIGTATAVGIILNDDEHSFFLVTNTNNSGPGSLRQAILDANNTPGRDTIRFDISGAGPHTIRPTSPLPVITDPVVIDGWTEPDFAGQPIVELDGSLAGNSHGLVLTAGESLIRGLTINRFDRFGIVISGAAANGNVVQGNFIGTNTGGTTALGNGLSGIWIINGAHDNLVGTNGDGIGDDQEGNLVSGNTYDGIAIEGLGTNGNVVAGNRIGTDITGMVPLGNNQSGVFVLGGAKFNRVGTDGDGLADLAEQNVICGNRNNGVLIGGAGTDENVVAGNYIGVGADGLTAVGNTHGVRIQQGAQRNRIGTDGSGLHDTAERNVISGNQIDGILIIDSGTDANVVASGYRRSA